MQSLDPAAASIIPPELTGPTPRRVRFDRWLLIMPTLLLAVFSGIPTYQALRLIQQRNALRRNSKEVLGWIDEVWHAGRAHVPTVSYTFVVHGINRTGQAEVPKRIYATLHSGDVLEIRYVPSDPSINHPASWEWSAGWENFVVPVIGLASVIFYRALLRRQRHLAVEGIPAFATVTGTSRGRNGPIVKYEFRTDGGIYQGSDSSPGRKATGTRICILYLPNDPNRNGIYPLSAYRVLPAGEF